MNEQQLMCLTCTQRHQNKILIEQGNQKDLHNARLKTELEHQKALIEKICNLINEFDDFSGEPSILGIEIKKIISENLEVK